MRASIAGSMMVLTLACVPMARPTDPNQWAKAHRACRSGAQDACFWVGISFEQRGDYASAKKHYTSACDSGVGLACFQLAHNAFYGNGEPENFEAGMRLAKQACELDDSDGCHLIGIALYRGWGVPKDLAASTAYYARACAKDNKEACRDYGKALNEGRGVPVDKAGAKALWRKYCPQDDTACSLLAGQLQEEGKKKDSGLAVAREGCAAGGSGSCYSAGDILWMYGDYDEAARYFRTACAWGKLPACDSVGLALRKMNPPRDFEAELVWKEACERGSKRSCHRLARFYVLRDGRTDERVAKIEQLCGEGVQESCEWLCEDAQKDLASPSCKSACSLGAKQYCAP